MRKTLLFFLVAIFATSIAFADDVSKLSISTQMFLDKLNGNIKEDTENIRQAKARGLTPVAGSFEAAEKESKFVADPIVKDGQTFMSAFVRLENPAAISKLESLGVEIEEIFLDGKLVTALIPVDKIEEVAAIADVNRVNAATMMRKSTNTARQRTNVDDVLTYSADAQSAGLPSSFDGSGVVLGVIDTGIDFNHIAFKDASGNSRIKQAYVYNGSTASTYTGSSITSTLTDDKSEDHGTHTSSTAGGSSVKVSGTTVTVTNDHSSATYGGMAPGSDLYLAGINGLNDTYLANAINNMCSYADQQGKPLVVSNSWGSQIGPHDGTGDVADIYNSLFGDNHPNRVALFAASNDGGASPASEAGGYHVKGTSSSASPLGSILRCHYYSDTDNGFYYNGIVTNAWFRSTVSNVTVKVLVLNSSTGAKVAETTVTPTSSGASVSGLSSYYSGSLYAYKDYISANGKTQVMLYANGFESRSYTSSYQSNYTLAIQIYPTNGSATLDMWGGNGGYFTSHLSTNGYSWTSGTDDGCYSDEATIANVISIGAYATKNGGMNTDYTIGDIAYFSSWGTTATSLTGQFYPWITAPGARIIAAVNHNHTSSVDNYSYYGSNFNGDLVVNSSTNPYAYMEGTSMATPTAAGIVALWLQASMSDNAKSEYKNSLTVNKVKQIMAQTAIHDSYTDTGANADHFGNGKIDALAGIAEILDNNSPTITANPTSVAFGYQVAGGTYSKTFTVTGANLEGSITLAKSGSSAFTIDKTSVTKTTAEGSGATVTVTFKPTAYTTADYTGTVTLTSSNASSVTVSLTGKGVYTAPAITANPTSLSFTGNSGTTYTKTVTVTGTNLQGNITAAIQNDANGFYSVSPTTINNSNGSASSTVTVTWAPTAGGTSTANLVLTTTGTGASSVTVPITGTAQGPTITANPTSVTFTGAYATRTYTQAVTVTGTNLTQNITAAISGANVYSIDNTSLTKTGGTITVTYAPTAAGTTNATLTLSSTGASSVTVPITGTAQAATPTLVVSPASLTFSTDLENSQQQTFAVTGRFIGGAVNVALTDANGVFTVSPTSIPAASISEDTPVNVTVTFQSATAGTYNGAITLTSQGAESKTVTLNATANDGGTASDVYLDIAKYATIDEAGWNSSYVNNLYKYTEYDDEAWLTLPIYGAWSSIYYNPNAQKWITTNVTNTSNKYAGSSWNSSEKLLGSSPYFTSTNARAMGYNSRNNTTQETFSFFVTNTTAVQMLGLGQSRASSSYPATLKVYECTKNVDGTVTAGTTAVKSYSNSATSGTFVLSATDLDASKIYKVEAATYRSYIAEIGFQTPLNKPSLTATPTELSLRAAPGETATATFNVKGKLLSNNVTVTLSDQSGVFAVNPASISISDAQAGSDVTVSFNSEIEGTFTGTVTLTSGDLSATVNLSGSCNDGGTASDKYLNIAKYATIDEAGATVSGMSSIYKYTEYSDEACAWLTVSNYGAMQADDNQNWLETSSLTSYSNTWSATDIFLGNGSYFSSGGYSIYGSGSQTFYVANCTQVKSMIKGGSANATLAIYECAEGSDGTLTIATSATDTKTGNCSSSSPAVITSAALDASKIYKVVLTGGGSYPDLLEIGFQTPLNTATLKASPTGIDFIAEPGQTITETVTVTGARLTDDVTVTLTDENGVYTLDKSSISIAEATAGATVTVTFNAPQQMGSYRGQVTFTSGSASAKTIFYGAVGEKGSAYSNYLDIAKYSTIATGNWYTSVFANAYKWTEYEDDQCAWLTVPAALPYYAWNFNDQNWCGVSSIASGGWYGHQWTATDVFQGYEYFKGTFEDETDTYAHMMGPNVSSDAISTNTSMFYGIYQVTNCTQVKALCYNNGTATSYPAFIQIYEMTENADGSLTRSETRTDYQSGTTSGSAVTMTSAELDASKIYFVAVGGYRGFTYEVAFKTPLVTTEATLAEIEKSGSVGQKYKVTDQLLAVRSFVDGDDVLLWCKDDNKSIAATSNDNNYLDYMQVQYAAAHNGAAAPESWDQSNWVVLRFVAPGSNNIQSIMSAVGHYLNPSSITGTYTDAVNYTITMPSGEGVATDAIGAEKTYVENFYCTANFLTANHNGNATGNTPGTTGMHYFFVNPKIQEVCEISFAVWNGEFFVAPESEGNSNDSRINGAFNVAWDYNDTPGAVDNLSTEEGYKFIGVVQKPVTTTSAVSIKSPASGMEPDGTYVVYPLNLNPSSPDNIVTAIHGIYTDGYREVVGVEYVNAVGVVSDRPFQGVNIVVTRYSDGSHTVKKIVK